MQAPAEHFEACIPTDFLDSIGLGTLEMAVYNNTGTDMDCDVGTCVDVNADGEQAQNMEVYLESLCMSNQPVATSTTFNGVHECYFDTRYMDPLRRIKPNSPPPRRYYKSFWIGITRRVMLLHSGPSSAIA